MKKPYGLVINQDGDGFLRSVGQNLEKTTVQALRDFAWQYRDSNVTDFFICVCNATASYPSKIWTSVLDKYYQTEEAGEPVDYKDHDVIKGAHHIFETLGVDNIRIWHEEFRKMGIKPWISFRMNDAHDHMLDRSFLLTEMYHKHPEFYRVQHAHGFEYFDRIWDFAHPEIRTFYLDFVSEALERYDTDGVEFDFLREPLCFSIGGEYEGIDIMTQFMRDLKARVDASAKARGHAIQVAFRCPQTPELCMDFGFDVATYAKEHLIDVVIPCGRCATNDNELPIRLWCSVMHPYGVSVWGGVENSQRPNLVAKGPQTLESVSGIVSAMMYQGAEKAYVYNFFRGIFPQMKPAAEQDGSDGYWNRIATVGDYDKMMQCPRRVMVTFRDFLPLGYPDSNKLPITLKKAGKFTLRFSLGEVPATSSVYIRFSMSNGDLSSDDLKVWISGRDCTFVKTMACEDVRYTAETLYCFQCNAPIQQGIAIAEIRLTKDCETVCDFAEIVIVPADFRA